MIPTIIIIILFLAYIGYREWMFNAILKDLQLKLLAKGTEEYARYKHLDKPAEKTEPKKEELLEEPLEATPDFNRPIKTDGSTTEGGE